jgi:hypothetical protein
MGYNTEFDGCLTFNKPLPKETADYIVRFSRIRHMTRNPKIIKKMDPNWKQHCWNGDLGPNGIYYVVPENTPVEFFEEDDPNKKSPYLRRMKAVNGCIENTHGDMIDKSVTSDAPPKEVPGYWCQWTINDEGNLAWDCGEKFYEYVPWLKFLIEHFFAPEGYVLDGDIIYDGEDCSDHGLIRVRENVVEVIAAPPY